MPDQVRAFFAVAVYSEVGNGANTLFWTDRWLHGQCITDLAPRLFAAIPKRRTKQRTVQDALTNQTWISDIKGARTVGVMVDFLLLWDVLSDFSLQPGVEDRHIWRFSSDGESIRPRLHTRDFLWGLYLLSPVKEFGRPGRHPNAASLFGWWLTTVVGQRIALHAVDYLILSTALCVTRLQKPLITS